jgi:RNA polymerase sigma-70 factor (ECF subfamily)
MLCERRAQGVTPQEALGAWQELRARLQPYVARRVASASDADDVLQEVLVRMHRGLGQLRGQERFGSWVFRIAEHAIIDNARMRARHPVMASSSDDPIADRFEGSSEDDALLPALTECVALFVARLPSPYREAVTLTELEGLSQRDAAELLGVSLSGLKSRVQRGRQKMRAMFEACCEISLDNRGRVLECTPRRSECVVTACDERLKEPSSRKWNG